MVPDDELVVRGREATIILPLSPDAHALWDKYAFALCPIEHPTDPQHRLFLQMVWLTDLHIERGLVTGDWDNAGRGGIVDLRRGRDGLFPAIRHGDVYELVTSDLLWPVPCPA